VTGDPLNMTEVELLHEASDRLAGAISAVQDLAMSFPSRERSVALTELQTGVLWLRASAVDPFCPDCGAKQEVPS
jgi:hypothetical protein